MQTIAANRSWTPELDRRARALAWILLDVDGVLTDGRIHVGPEGELFKSFHVRDGLAIKLARSAGLAVGILSARSSEIVERRARELDFNEIVQGREDKGAAFRELLDRHGLDPASVAYVGDDLQDLPVLGAAGLSIAPADAAPQVLAAVDFVTDATGGQGCVRELVERILVAREAWSRILRGFAARGGEDAPAD
ncbi:MAG TPA: HAD-IIIA family hydrolase [Thermoanaerobaculia bacterium]|nr:HAD-IIIA family hydrolase [Thermoanaerobaculia bacterium]